MMNRWAFIFFLGIVGRAAQGENLLKNPGFEYEGDWTAYQSASLRNQWRSHDGGQYSAAILGLWADQEVGGPIDRTQWADRGPNGMIEQRGIPVEPGGEYVFRAWLWADEGWAPREQYLKITFSGKGGFVLGEERLDLPAIPPDWTRVELRAKAPANATRAAVSITARGVSAYGALTIDDLSLSAESSPTP